MLTFLYYFFFYSSWCSLILCSAYLKLMLHTCNECLSSIIAFLNPRNSVLIISVCIDIFISFIIFSYPIVLFSFATLSIFTIVLIFFPLINPMPMFLQEQFSVIYFVPLNRPYFPIYLYILQYFVDIAADFAKSRSWKFWKSGLFWFSDLFSSEKLFTIQLVMKA